MKINIYSISRKPEEWEFALVSFLEQDKDFQNLVFALRRKLRIGKDGLLIKDWLNPNIFIFFSLLQPLICLSRFNASLFDDSFSK